MGQKSYSRKLRWTLFVNFITSPIYQRKTRVPLSRGRIPQIKLVPTYDCLKKDSGIIPWEIGERLKKNTKKNIEISQRLRKW